MASLPPETDVGRVCLVVADRERVLSFYRDVLGLDVVADGGPTLLGAGGEVLVQLAHDPDAPERPAAATGLFHLALRVPSRAALGAALGRIEAAWRLDGASDHGVSEALYLTDPEGNGVEVYRDRPRGAWPTAGDRVAMTSEPLALEALRSAGDGRGLPADADVGHVHLEVSDLTATSEFYVGRLGMALRQELGDARFFAAGDYHHHVGANTWRGRTGPPSGRGLAWVELRVPDGAVDAVRERFPDAAAVPGGFAVTDPDGVELRVRAEGGVL